MIQKHQDLIVWQKSMDLVLLVYKFTKLFPKDELYGLVSQTRRAVISIPANIAEGRSRGSRKDFRNFLIIAFGSANELSTLFEIALRLDYINPSDYKQTSELLTEILKMLKVIIEKLRS